MITPLSSADLERFGQFLESSLSHPDQDGNRELCDRVMELLRHRSQLSQADLGFLKSWLKARDLIVAGLQVLEMADEGNAEAIRHERECTEMAFNLLPCLVDEAHQGAEA